MEGTQGSLGAVAGVEPAYSHMGEEDAELFYATINALLVYANERLGVVDPARLRPRAGSPLMLFENGGRVSEELWKRRWLVDDFVRENPFRLPERQLEVARPWRFALRDMFCALAADADRAVYMNQDRIVIVGAMQDDADAHVHATPSLMLLTLLPFRGGIVTDGKTLHLSPRPHAWALPEIAARARTLAQRRPIVTADDLMAYARKIPDDEDRLTPHFGRAVAEAFASGAIA
ncbi:MAG TPA: hypothetical protein IAA19_06750 [Candidatus Olsenella pullistercoris]|uniref:Uncharacterized protein n=1 Tax=Candidatus Olsenella pullistercoris TaxID=2838712 RepID=A0A9D2EZC4_9ACTN|nr:hypothetical protein [Candidatus Olsenella pullistercoris]